MMANSGVRSFYAGPNMPTVSPVYHTRLPYGQKDAISRADILLFCLEQSADANFRAQDGPTLW